MTLAVSRRVPEAGHAFAVAMFLGVAAVLITIAATIAFARRWSGGWIGRHGARLAVASRWLDTLAGMALIAIALHELAR